MEFLDFLSNIGLPTIVAGLVVAGLGLAGMGIAVVLRFVRRGATRFWLVPALLSAALMPVVAGIGLSALSVHKVVEACVFMGVGVSAGLAAGLLESQLPLLVGLVSTTFVCITVLALITLGSSRGASPEGESRRGGSTILASLVVVLGVMVVLVLEIVALGGAMDDLPGALSYSSLFIWVAGGLLIALVAGALLFTLTAPATAAPGLVKVVAYALPLAVALGALVLALGGIGYGQIKLQRIMAGEIPVLPDEPGVELPPLDSPPEFEATPPPRLDSPPPQPPPPPSPRRRNSSPSSTPSAPPPAPAKAVQPQAAEQPAPIPEPIPAPSQGPPKPVRVGGSIKEPRKLKDTQPVYPAIAKQARVQGIVILECTIDHRGKVSKVKILRGIPLLDQAAIDAVEQWEYEPTLLNGVPATLVMTVTVNFSLK